MFEEVYKNWPNCVSAAAKNLEGCYGHNDQIHDLTNDYFYERMATARLNLTILYYGSHLLGI